ncbi:long-chain fatty acid--CoA ligase [Rhodococcus olei]|uniref:Long-chain fatty acid--CoA ligase n=1 Tax=Rhodococcus olei TaxID=2161675 RepID=A0ABP8NYN3_9NOCA
MSGLADERQAMKPILTDVTLAHEPLWARAAHDPNGDAVEFQAETLTWGQLKANVTRAAAMLKSLGISPGGRVGLLSRNSPVFVELALAAAALGASVTPMNWRLTAEETTYIATDSELEILFVETEFTHNAPVADRVPTLRTVLPADYADYRYIVDAHPADPIDSKTVTEDSTALIMYSSGTTGRPKGVLIPHRSLIWRAKRAEPEVLASDRPLGGAVVPMPMFHIAGLAATLYSLALGRRVNILQEARADLIFDAIERGYDQTFLAPTLLQTVLDDGGPEKETIGKLRELRYGASPMPLNLLERALREWPEVEFSQAYGLTETAGGVVELTNELHRNRADDTVLRSAGEPLPGVEIRIVDPVTSQECQPGSTGEVWVRCPYMATGYHRNPEATAETFTADGWLRTGDIGELSTDGYLFIRDRLKDMIISGGENIYTSEVELVIGQFSGVAAVAVVGVPDDKWGERPLAYLEVDDPDHFDTDQLREFCRARLAAFKVPDRFTVISVLPRTATGKILKRELGKGAA